MDNFNILVTLLYVLVPISFIIYFQDIYNKQTINDRIEELRNIANNIINGKTKAEAKNINKIIDELNSGKHKLTEDDNVIITKLRAVRDKAEHL